jgi:hypothetical protein
MTLGDSEGFSATGDSEGFSMTLGDSDGEEEIDGSAVKSAHQGRVKDTHAFLSATNRYPEGHIGLRYTIHWVPTTTAPDGHPYLESGFIV